MSKIGGIIYPSAFQVTELIGSMNIAFQIRDNIHYFRHKNLEFGTWQSTIETNEKKNIWALFDGEIYNADELRKELIKEYGFKFSTTTQEEVLVHAYENWQEEFLKHLNGPFALAIFDEEKEILIIARDRLGQKPLYWTSQGEYWLFSTEIKGLLATGIVSQTPSLEGLASYFYFGFVPQDLSIINGVNKVLPGHFLKVDLNRQVMIDQYWSFSQHLETQHNMSQEEVYHQLGKHLEEAIKLSLPKEGEIGCFLKGNLGSSAMTWFLSHQTPRHRIHTYSAFFEEPQPIELQNASETASMLSLSHMTKRIQPEEVIEELPAIVWHLDEPVADPYVLQTWHLAKLASPECSVIYADIGWEEMFAGSRRFFPNETTNRYPRRSLAFLIAHLPSALRDSCILFLLNLFHINYKYRILRNIDINHEQISFLMESALFKGKGRKKLSPPLFRAFNPEVFTQRFHRLTSLAGSINPSIYYDAKTKLPDSALFQYEELLSAHNIRAIHPFLDYRLVEFLASIPENLKFQDKIPAGILKTLMERLCHQCPSFDERQDSFLDTWRYNPKFRALFAQLKEGRLEDEGLISARWIKQQLGYPYLIPRTFHQLWSILVLEIWFRLYITRPIKAENSTLSIEKLLKSS